PAHNVDKPVTSSIFEVHTTDDGCAVSKYEKPNNDGLVGGCADEKEDTGEKDRYNTPTDRTCMQCRGPIDGTERLVAVSGRSVWLHPECEKFWFRALDQAGEH